MVCGVWCVVCVVCGVCVVWCTPPILTFRRKVCYVAIFPTSSSKFSAHATVRPRLYGGLGRPPTGLADATTTVARAPRVAEFFAKLRPKIARTTSTAGHQNRLIKIARPTGGPELESRLYGPQRCNPVKVYQPAGSVCYVISEEINNFLTLYI